MFQSAPKATRKEFVWVFFLPRKVGTYYLAGENYAGFESWSLAFKIYNSKGELKPEPIPILFQNPCSFLSVVCGLKQMPNHANLQDFENLDQWFSRCGLQKSGIKCHLRTLSGHTPYPLKQKLWEWGQQSVLTGPPGDSDAC